MENEIRMADLDGEFYLSRINCEFYDVLDGMCREHGANLVKSYQSEREDWILTMVAAGMGVCFLPEYTAIFPGVVARPVVSPSVARDVCMVTVAGRRWSAPVAAFVQAVRRHPWPSVWSPPTSVKLGGGCRRLTRFMAEVISSAYRPYTLATFHEQRRAA